MSNTSSDLSQSLKELGFTKKSIVEIILVTVNNNGTFNAAPMGVVNHNSVIETRPFLTSRTYQNLHRYKKAAINITNNPYIFLATAFKDEIENPPRIIDFMLEDSEAVIRVEKISESKYSELQAVFLLKPLEIMINRQKPLVFSRGRAEAIEAVIHATRIKVFDVENQRKKVTMLMERLDYCLKVIDRVSEKYTPEMIVAEKIRDMIEHWGIKK
ncbi:DUF447 domain-containing protein [Thermoproteota archaeon]